VKPTTFGTRHVSGPITPGLGATRFLGFARNDKHIYQLLGKLSYRIYVLYH
jgi:hypothetical protein